MVFRGAFVWKKRNCSARVSGKRASGGPAGGQTFEKFDKQVFMKMVFLS
jgi:hypothetical protein